MIESIIFDWDDVFTKGSTEGYFRCYHQALIDVGVKLKPQEEKRRILKNWGAAVETELGGLLKEYPKLLNRAIASYHKNLFGGTFVDCLTVIPGSIELLNNLRGNYKLSIATGVHPKLLKDVIMPNFEIPNIFDPILSVYDLNDPQKAKPNPYMLQQILKIQNIKPTETIFVGDAEGDVLMAKAAGVTPVAVLTGHLTRKQAQDLNVDYIIEDVTHLEEVLGKLK